jgi:Glu-tRNA(Gln) amidotransferase subunit E-like FAD-binding protein
MFNGLKGLSIPAKSLSHCGNVGNFIDQHIKNKLNITNVSSVVDLENYGIEIKSKDISTNTDWSIGSMTLEDILNNTYQTSSVYKKLQALLLIDVDDTFQVVKDIGLYYFDIDEIQMLFEESYESARKQIQQRVAQHAVNVAKSVESGNFNAVLGKVNFGSYEKFQGDFGKFEYTNNGNSFQFRITLAQMKHLTTLAASQSSLLAYE